MNILTAIDNLDQCHADQLDTLTAKCARLLTALQNIEKAAHVAGHSEGRRLLEIVPIARRAIAQAKEGKI
jgi:hypothetical protein